jgi:hypothetical protein
MIAAVDEFILLDDVQYTRRDWRNRNQIKTPHGKQWLTIPVHSRGSQVENIPINQIRIAWDSPWNQNHLKAFQHAYARAPHFARYLPLLQEFYQRCDELLADFTIDFAVALTRELGNTHTRFMRSSELRDIDGRKTERLIQILRAVGATHYLSGPSAGDYIEQEKFAAAGITLEYMEYNYPEYPQLYPPFDPQVSILDLLFMTGPEASHYLSKGNHVRNSEP